jgi:isopentenyldiphosphate isomerase
MNNLEIDQEMPDSEPLLIVDIHDHVIGSGAKPDVHQARQWHRQSYVVIVAGNDRVLLQKRSPRRQFDPGRWTTSVSGHVTGEDSYLVSAQREVREEIGVEPPELIYLGKVLAYSEAEGQICGGPSAVFVGFLDVDVKSLSRQEAEVADVGWFGIDELAAALNGSTELRHKGERVEFSEDFRPVFEFFLNSSRASSKADSKNEH